jgi:integrase
LLIDELRKRRIEQALLSIGVGLTLDHHVVIQGDGTPLQPNSLTHAFSTFLAARGLPRIRLHDLRQARYMLAAGIHPEVASERLGRSKVGITLDLYSHMLPGMQSEAATLVDALISDALQRHRNAKG